MIDKFIVISIVLLGMQYIMVFGACVNDIIRTKKDFIISLIPFGFVYFIIKAIQNFWRELK